MLKVGDTIPEFTATDANGNQFNSHSIIGKKWIVVYFYPKDDTPGCTAEACSFRDQYQDFKDLDAEIIGISSDDVNSHQKFIQKYNLPFLLLSDYDKKIRTLFGVPNNLLGLIPGRITYVIDKKGVIRYVFDSLMGKIHVSKALSFLKHAQ